MQYDLEYVSQKSIKGQAIADQLADFPLTEEIKAEDDFPDEHICNIQQPPVWNLFFDGSKNMSGIGIGVLLITPEKEMIPYSLKLGFQCTHNMAEYEALIQGLKILQSFNVKRVHAFGDSLLVVSQVNTEWQVKDSKLIPYQKIVLALVDSFEEFQLNHIRREHNQIADGLASLGSILSFKGSESCRSFEVGRLEQPAFISTMQVNQVDQKEKPWYQNIKNFIETGEFPPEMPKREQRAIQRMSTRLFHSCQCPLPPWVQF